MKKLLMCLLVAGFYGCDVHPTYGQNSALAQLGAKGVTESGGTTNYAHYILRLGNDGRIAAVAMPTGLQSPAWSHLCFIDAAGSDNSTQLGGPSTPYKTLAYASTNYQYRTNSGVVYIFGPGTYESTTFDALTNPGLRDISIWGYDAAGTYIDAIQFLSAHTGAEVVMDVTGVRIGTLRQSHNQPFTLRLTGGAKITLLDDTSATYPCMVYSDLSSSVTAATLAYTNVLLYTAADISYAGTNTVKTALDTLYAFPSVLVCTNAGDMLVWSGSNWTPIAAGTTNDFLIGGTTPYFTHRYIQPGTEAGQVPYWDPATTNWARVTATTNAEYVLFGGTVPGFSRMPASYVSYTNDAGTNNIQTVVYEQGNVIANIMLDTNYWTWAAGTWSNSPSRNITTNDIAFWNWASSLWSNTVAQYITSADTNTWTQAATSWLNSVAHNINTSDLARWDFASNIATNSSTNGIWGLISGTLTDQSDLQNELTNRHTKSEILAFGYLQETTTAHVVMGGATIDAANNRTNTYGGSLIIIGERVQDSSSTATGERSWAKFSSTASGEGAWAMYGATASGAGSWAFNGGVATGESSYAISYGKAYGLGSFAMNTAIASNNYSFAWDGLWTGFPDYYGSHGQGTFNLNPVGGLSGIWIGETNLQVILDNLAVDPTITNRLQVLENYTSQIVQASADASVSTQWLAEVSDFETYGGQFLKVNALETGVEFGTVSWADIDKSVSSLGDIVARSHTVLTDIGSLTHADLDSHIQTDTYVHPLSTNLVHTSGDETISGVKTFDVFPVTPSENPATDFEVANKQYVDSMASGLSWKAPVLDKDMTNAPAASEGDRYIVPTNAVGEWSSQTKNIATYGTNWTYETPEVGWAVLTLDDTKGWTFSSTSNWVQFTAETLYTASRGVQKVGNDFRANYSAAGGLDLSGNALIVKVDGTKIIKTGAGILTLGPLTNIIFQATGILNTVYMDVDLLSANGAAQWTRMPSGTNELFSNTSCRVKMNLTSASKYRIFVNQSVVGFSNSTLALEYSTDALTWLSAETGTTGRVSTSLIGWRASEFEPLVDEAKADVYLRVIGCNGNGVASPAWRQLRLQFEVPSVAPEVNTSYTNLVGLVALSFDSVTNLAVDAMAQAAILMTLTNDVVIDAPTNALVDGRTLKWRFLASGGDRTVTWNTNVFVRPRSSAMTASVVVSNNAISVFATEYVAGWTNWLIEAHVPEYYSP